MKIQKIKKSNNLSDIANLINDTHEKGDYMFSDQKSDPESVSRILKNKNFHLFIASVEGKMVGFCLVLIRKNTKEIKHIAKIQAISVLKDFRGKGVGSELLKYTINWLKKNKTHTVYLEVISDNKGAVSLYKKNKFKKSGEIKGFAIFNKNKCNLSTYVLNLV